MKESRKLLGQLLVVCLALAAAAFYGRAVRAGNESGNRSEYSTAPLSVSLVPFAAGLDEPVDIANAGDSRLFVVERAGRIKIVQSSGTVLPTPFLDITATVGSESYVEEGLLGLAFHPNYASNGYFYVYYTDNNSDIRVSRFSMTANPNVADPNSEQNLLLIPHPGNRNHNGGDLNFGPDGYLYIGPGDGGGGGDPGENAQDLAELLGKILRINVTGVTTYTIPVTNPFTQTAGARGEIWALGLRNPWRFSFDRQTGDMYIGDVGQNAWEEIDFQASASLGGENYGWDCYEGNHPYEPAGCGPMSQYAFPVHEYSQALGNVVTGGYVYRGAQYPGLAGYYFFTDYGSGRWWAMQPGTWQVTYLGQLLSSCSSFGEDSSGELYAAGHFDGIIYRVQGDVPAPTATRTATPGATATRTPTATSTAFATPTATSSATAAATSTATPTAVASATAGAASLSLFLPWITR